MNQPTFAVAVTFQIKEEFVEAFRKRVLQQASDSVELEDGCYQFDVLTDEADESVFFLYETYVDADAFAAHKLTNHFLDFDRSVSPWVSSKQVKRLNLILSPQ